MARHYQSVQNGSSVKEQTPISIKYMGVVYQLKEIPDGDGPLKFILTGDDQSGKKADQELKNIVWKIVKEKYPRRGITIEYRL